MQDTCALAPAGDIFVPFLAPFGRPLMLFGYLIIFGLINSNVNLSLNIFKLEYLK